MDVDDGEESRLGFEDMYEIASSFCDLMDKLEEPIEVLEVEEEKLSFFKRFFGYR